MLLSFPQQDIKTRCGAQILFLSILIFERLLETTRLQVRAPLQSYKLLSMRSSLYNTQMYKSEYHSELVNFYHGKGISPFGQLIRLEGTTVQLWLHLVD